MKTETQIKLTATEKKSLFVAELSTITKTILESDLKRFENSEAQARYVVKAHLWLKSPSGKALMVREKCGIREVIKGNFPFDKSQYYHLLEFGRIAEEKPEFLKAWKKEVSARKEQKLSVSVSTTEFLKDYKEAQLETSGEGKPKPKGKEAPLFTFSKGTISAKFVNGELKGKGTIKEVLKALDEVRAMLEALTKPKANAKPTAKPKVKPTAKAKAKAKAKQYSEENSVVSSEAELLNSPF